MQWQCRTAPSLGGGFEGTPESVWGTPTSFNSEGSTVFFGLYGLPDFYALWRHIGTRAILWAGSDITHFKNGYWLDKEGKIRVDPKPLAKWIEKNCISYVENSVEQKELKKLGINAKVVPSFLGNLADYPVSYESSDTPKLYTSVSGDDFKLYGWDNIDGLAKLNPEVEFHLYGNYKEWTSKEKNVIIHGRIPKEQMNSEIKRMQGALRLTEFDGFSEIIAKSLLWGQYPVSIIEYPTTLKPEEIHMLKTRKRPNTMGRAWILKNVNQYPWNQKHD